MVKTIKKYFVEISFSVLERAPFKHFEHTKTFFREMFYFYFFFNIHKNAFGTNSIFVSQKCARNKKRKKFFD